MSGAQSFHDVLVAHATRAPAAPLVLSPEAGTTLTYGDTAAVAHRLDAAFDAWGIARGDVVAFMLPNGIAAASAFIGTMAAGRVVAPFNLVAQDAHLDHVLRHASPRAIFATEEHATRLRDAIARTGVDARLVVTSADELAVPAARSPSLQPVDPHAGAMLMYTSGTTGMPKGVRLTHANMLHTGRAVAGHQHLGTGDRVLTSLPLYHINGQCIACASTLVSGGSLVLPYRFSASQWWPQVERFGPTWLNLVPTIVAYLLNGPDLTAGQRDAARRVRFARSASAPLPPEQQRAFEERFGIPVVEAMGLTETASLAFCNPMPPAARRIGSAGKPLGIEARVVARDGKVLGAGETGEIELRGPSVMRGYHRPEPDATPAVDAEGWLATGDLGHRDAEDFYFITGRLKELIIKGGENIAPREIDEALLRHPAILEAAAVGVPDRDYGQEIMACVVVKPDHALTADAVLAHCRQELGRYKTPRYVTFVESLPKGPSGKVQRMKLADALKR
ncbi:MAG: AMP-binding protein [Proteobacteria bacterium]|nr:AMP-binding protein [Pseudomonadota bacterium]